MNPNGLGSTKLSLIPGKESNSIYCNGSCGPVFGSGNDLYISNDANKNTTSLSILGSSYQCPPGQQSTFFAGANNFTVTDYEVFGLL